MRKVDYEYIANKISSLSLITIRVYKNREQIIYCDPAGFPKDPASYYLDSLLLVNDGVNYYISPYGHFYGVVKYREHTMILGPTFQISPSRNQIREFMFSLGLKLNYMEHYKRLLNNITPMPLELFLQELCLIFYYVSDIKLELSDVSIYDSHTKISKQNTINKKVTDVPYMHDDVIDSFSDSHTTINFENQMLDCVREGDLKRLSELIDKSSVGRPGKVAPTYLRQLKNIFISSATLLSRAAIEGGLSSEEALTLSDQYIQHAESYDNPEQVMNLQHNMVIDYTTLVNEIKNGTRYDKFMRTVISYVHEHLTEDFTIEEMAKDLYMNRSYLSTKFKRETGVSLSQFVQMQKIEKAKNLLKSTDRTILEISTYLGFSSQGYFQNVFKKHTHMTPKDYRNQ